MRNGGEASELFNPIEWALLVKNSESLESVFDNLIKRLKYATGGDTVFVLNTRLPQNFAPGNGLKFPAPDHVFGCFLNEEFHDYIVENDISHLDPMPKRVTPNCRPIVGWEGSELFRSFNDEEREYERIYYSFGFNVGIFIPNLNLQGGTLDGMALHMTAPVREAQAFLSAHLDQLQIAHAYLCEATRTNKLVLEHDAERPFLSPRERECVSWATAGYSTREISDRIKLSDDTINEYLRNAAKKLGASTRAQTCARATMAGLIDP